MGSTTTKSARVTTSTLPESTSGSSGLILPQIAPTTRTTAHTVTTLSCALSVVATAGCACAGAAVVPAVSRRFSSSLAGDSAGVVVTGGPVAPATPEMILNHFCASAAVCALKCSSAEPVSLLLID